MPDFHQLPARPLLRKWAFYDGSAPYAYLAEFLNGLGYRITTRKGSPEGRRVSSDDVRRFIHREVQRYPEYPTNRSATQDDFDRIRIAIITEDDGEELL